MSESYTNFEIEWIRDHIKAFFTDDEWGAIESALEDYQDQGEPETALKNSINNSIHLLFNGSYEDIYNRFNRMQVNR